MSPPWLILFWVSVVSAVQCPDGSTCEEQKHCCKLPSRGSYGCCPMDTMVYQSLPMVVSHVSCSDSESCPDEYLCVKTPQEYSACCPLQQGFSCSDGHHCCPLGTLCSEDGHYCLPDSNVTAIICPDGKSECPNDATCCAMPDQTWGCCPMPQATCCSDGLHCCPHNTLCDMQHGRCISADGSVPWLSKLPARLALGNALQKIPCPDKTSCPDGATCCLQSDKSTYGCCPFMSAVCCSDNIHCCPSGMLCDLIHNKCVLGRLEIPMYTKSPALQEEVMDVPCDETSRCPNKNTCCRLASGEWGCCPIEQAVCCPDHEHCCPQGYTCSGGSCERGQTSIPWLSKVPAVRHKSFDVPCDETTSCPDKNTCCRLASGEWGCCPIEQAVCCPDHEHCCPQGYTCSGGSCEKGQISIPWLKKVPAVRHKSFDVPCDETTSCPDKNTCCRLASGEWGCCPIEQAVCCPDHEHCCPQGYTCSGGSCEKGQISIPWLNKVPAVRHKSFDVPCDETTSCPDKNTCCRLASGEWGCCPIEQAVCCPDHEHCCPQGYTCSGGSCEKGQISIPWLNKVPAVRHKFKDVPCDDTTSCPDKNTCCRLESGEWGCCPIEQAVCCADHIHCCPPGFTCSGGSCESGQVSIPWLSKTPAVRRKANDVPCDETSSCPDKNTCCRLASGEWGCCPIEQAVCCNDHEHCCPHGFTCSGSSCVGVQSSIPWLTKTPAVRQMASDVPCDETSSCPDKNTCCRLESGEWGCCPIEQAVCCPDHEHCCPHGYTCSEESCTSGQVSIPWFRKTPSMRHEVGNVSCDATTVCPDKNTCCRMESGAWGCCPIEEAVCCPDHWHCCPKGFSCDAQGSCVLGDLSIPWFQKTPALHSHTVKCDATYSCAQGTTCCPTETGDWACCPLEEAVCCTDHQHCCPHGYTCDLQSATCIKPKQANEPLPSPKYVWCDSQHSCFDGQTCCRGLGGTWSCCPYTSGVCCPDMVHCCPYGYVCLGSGVSCIRSESLRWDGNAVWRKPTPLL
ncbi:progranulin [Bombina bombina]|uniref:progranulin n=1 Tax=Bombina bombina TaxID=8345 RepID=UPI00235AB26B|nr:progranulin [Bombina bombina]